jgi:hypothetical protein
MIDRIGKNSGGLMGGTPKYLHARSESNFEYAALAARVHGGLFPGVIHVRMAGTGQGLRRTGSDIDAAQEDGVESA